MLLVVLAKPSPDWQNRAYCRKAPHARSHPHCSKHCFTNCSALRKSCPVIIFFTFVTVWASSSNAAAHASTCGEGRTPEGHITATALCQFWLKTCPASLWVCADLLGRILYAART